MDEIKPFTTVRPLFKKQGGFENQVFGAVAPPFFFVQDNADASVL
jgi:hypothetical protein